MRIISKKRAQIAIDEMNEVRDLIISYIESDDKIEESFRSSLVSSVKVISINVINVFKFRKLPFILLNSKECRYIHICMTGYADLSAYYGNKPPKIADIHKSLAFITICFCNIGDILGVAEGNFGYRYLYKRNKNHRYDGRSLQQVSQCFLLNSCDIPFYNHPVINLIKE